MKYADHAKVLMASAVSFSLAFSPLSTNLAFAQSANEAQPPVQAGGADAAWEKEFGMWRNASKNGAAEDYEAYLKAYPEGKFAKVAASRIAKLAAAAMPEEAPQDNADASQPADNENMDADTAAADSGAMQPDDGAMAEEQADVSGDANPPAVVKQPPLGSDPEMADSNDQTVDEQAAQAPSDWEQEYALWKAASDGNTVAEYEAYLSAYPKGKFAPIAQSRIVALAAAEQPVPGVAEGDATANSDQAMPDDQQAQDDQMQGNDNADQAENDVGENDSVDRNAPLMAGTPETEDLLEFEGRAEMQGRLSSLGFDTGGADGSFGPRSRTAIAAWQEANGAPVTGYLGGDQIDLILQQSEQTYPQWMNQNQANERVVVRERPVVVEEVVRPRVVVKRRNHDAAIGAAIAIGVGAAILGSKIKGRKCKNRRKKNCF